jgi:hypothetical protein
MVRHPPLTGLDRASMEAAVRASFRGLYGRDPTGVPGSGVDDVQYWIAVSDHYGEFSDHVERAGWSRYWEVKLSGLDSADPALGDQPARFQPGAAPVPAPLPIPSPPAPTVEVDQIAAILTRLDTLERIVTGLATQLPIVAGDAYEAGHRKLPRYVSKFFGLTIVSVPEGS